MTRSQMRKLLDAHDIRLTKSLGQCFLHDTHQLQRIIDAAELSRHDKVLEIGAGLGPLTEHLLARAGEVLAIEKDRRLVKVLEQRFNVEQQSNLPPSVPDTAWTDDTRADAPAPADTDASPLHLVHGDALDILKTQTQDWSEWKVVSNLPYSVASPILVDLCRAARSPRQLVVTLQLEVVERLIANPGTRDYGVLTLLVLLDFAPGKWFKIPATCFFPQPGVDSACVVLQRRPTGLLEDPLRRVFVRLVKRAFSQRRKMMLKLLKQDWHPDALEAAYAQAGLASTIRAEAVSLDQFVTLTRHLGELTPHTK